MALIKCSECGKEISDKATVCPNCGNPVSSVNVANPTAITDKRTAKPKKLLAIIMVGIALICVCAFLYFQQQKQAERSQYINNLNAITASMLDGAARSESVCNLTKSVWYNTIYEKSDPETDPYTKTISGALFHSDFNDSLSSLYSADSTISTIAEIKTNREEVSALMSELSQPSDEFAQCYDTLTDMYNTYDKFTSLAISPTGSLQTYSSNFSEYDSDFMTSYNLMQTLIPEK